MHEDYLLLKTRFWIASDSIRIYQEIIENKDLLILNKDKEIYLFKSNEDSYKKIISEKDKQIVEYKRKYKNATIRQYIGFVALAAGIVIAL
jgi:hypothetical protein